MVGFNDNEELIEFLSRVQINGVQFTWNTPEEVLGDEIDMETWQQVTVYGCRGELNIKYFEPKERPYRRVDARPRRKQLT